MTIEPILEPVPRAMRDAMSVEAPVRTIELPIEESAPYAEYLPIPNLREVELALPVRIDGRAVSLASEHLHAVNTAMAELQRSIDRLVRSPPDENASSCRVWARQNGSLHHRLSLCERRGQKLAYRYRFEIGTEWDRRLVFETAVSGVGAVERGVNRGQIRYDLRFAGLVSGTIDLEFRIDEQTRKLVARTIDLPRLGTILSSTIAYEAGADGSGHAELILGADTLRTADGALWTGSDRELDANAIALAWTAGGAGRAERQSCLPTLDDCVIVRQCWTDAGAVSFFGFANVRSARLGWPKSGCAKVVLPSIALHDLDEKPLREPLDQPPSSDTSAGTITAESRSAGW